LSVYIVLFYTKKLYNVKKSFEQAKKMIENLLREGLRKFK